MDEVFVGLWLEWTVPNIADFNYNQNKFNKHFNICTYTMYTIHIKVATVGAIF